MKKSANAALTHSQKCTLCQKSFKTTDNRVKVCPVCKIRINRIKKEKSNQRKRAQLKKLLAELTVGELLAIAESYNRRHKTSFSYGKFITYAENGLIETEELINDIRPA